MAIVQENWLIMTIITGVSLVANWYFGARGRRFSWVLVGVVAALVAAILSKELAWADTTTATFAYGVLVIYCPLIWVIADKRQTILSVEKEVAEQRGNQN